MFNQRSIDSVNSAVFRNNLIRPLYGSYCFSELPSTIERLFGGDTTGLPADCLPDGYGRTKSVVVLFVDAFGWNILNAVLERSNDGPLRQLVEGGVVSKITSMFPSTTSAHVPTFHTGLTPGETGLFEWYQYAAGIGSVIRPLQSCFATSRNQGELAALGYDLSSYCPTSEFYERLNWLGVRSHCFYSPHIVTSPINQLMCRGANFVAYDSIASGLKQVGELLQSAERQYIFFYFDGVDHLAHVHGPYADPTIKVALKFWKAFEQHLRPALEQQKDTTLLVISDHGQTATNPERFISLENFAADILAMQRTAKDGSTISPVGSPRDLFLYIRPECVREAFEICKERFRDLAEVFLAEELMAEGLFGKVTDRLRVNMGDVVILPHAPTPIFWSGPNNIFVRNYKGNHGGLNREEAETILIAHRF